MRLQGALIAEARRRVYAAALVAVALGVLSLVTGIQTWRERRYLDLEILLGLLDAVAVLALAYGLTRFSRAAAILLLLLAALGVAYVLWRGFPPLALLPHAVGAVFYLRALLAVRLIPTQSD